jgi:ribonuclease D
MTIQYYKYDLPTSFEVNTSIAIDTEAMGLNNIRDRLCTVQMCTADGRVIIIHFPEPIFNNSYNLIKILTNHNIKKIFHFARFDVAILQYSFKISMQNLFCTKIASKLVRTYTDSHGLKELCNELLNVKISKNARSSDWGADVLSEEQLKYGADDVIYLHRLKNILETKLLREQRFEIAEECFKFIPTRAWLDVMGWDDNVINY